MNWRVAEEVTEALALILSDIFTCMRSHFFPFFDITISINPSVCILERVSTLWTDAKAVERGRKARDAGLFMVQRLTGWSHSRTVAYVEPSAMKSTQV